MKKNPSPLNKSLQKNKRKARSKVVLLYATYLTFLTTVLYTVLFSDYLTALKMLPVGFLISFLLFFLGMSVGEEKRINELQKWRDEIKKGKLL